MNENTLGLQGLFWSMCFRYKDCSMKVAPGPSAISILVHHHLVKHKEFVLATPESIDSCQQLVQYGPASDKTSQLKLSATGW
jgi:hypothetical protein